jgi:hypothetical protein
VLVEVAPGDRATLAAVVGRREAIRVDEVRR